MREETDWLGSDQFLPDGKFPSDSSKIKPPKGDWEKLRILQSFPNVPELSFEALLALLNSKVYSFIYRVLFGQIKVLRSNLSQLKLPSINPQQDDELKSLVLAAEANSTEEIKEEINRAIFKLYGLDDEEIAVIRKRLEA